MIDNTQNLDKNESNNVKISWIKVALKVILYLLFVFSMVMLSLFVGWQFVVGFVTTIFIHEFGHYIAGRKLHYSLKSVGIIPGLAAYIQFKEPIKNCKDDAIISIAGPISGTLVSLVYFVLYYFTNMEVFIAIAFFGLLLQAINLIPVYPLDGGGISGAISKILWLIGLPILIIYLL